MGGGGGMISGQAPAVNINLDGVRSEIASIKKETDEIKDALREQGEQLQMACRIFQTENLAEIFFALKLL